MVLFFLIFDFGMHGGMDGGRDGFLCFMGLCASMCFVLRVGAWSRCFSVAVLSVLCLCVYVFLCLCASSVVF